jgi:hypothetical protein
MMKRIGDSMMPTAYFPAWRHRTEESGAARLHGAKA